MRLFAGRGSTPLSSTMGAYSTVTITREQAIERICNALDQATNEELSEALFALTANHVLDNYSVVDEKEE